MKSNLTTFLRSHMEMNKIYNRAKCVCAFRKWVKCQKRLKSTKLDNSVIIKQNTSEVKMKGAVIRQPTPLANCKVCKVSVAYTLTK